MENDKHKGEKLDGGRDVSTKKARRKCSGLCYLKDLANVIAGAAFCGSRRNCLKSICKYTFRC
jgi:hypothetical protein